MAIKNSQNRNTDKIKKLKIALQDKITSDLSSELRPEIKAFLPLIKSSEIAFEQDLAAFGYAVVDAYKNHFKIGIILTIINDPEDENLSLIFEQKGVLTGTFTVPNNVITFADMIYNWDTSLEEAFEDEDEDHSEDDHFEFETADFELE